MGRHYTPRERAVVDTVGGLSEPSKMPDAAWGIPIHACELGRRLRATGDPRLVCVRCYAGKGRSAMPDAQRAQELRLARLRHALSSPEAADAWVDAFRVLLERVRWFRWFDAGDLQGPAHLELIARVARATPATRHWLPTREAGHVLRWLEAGGELLPNLRIRLSGNVVGRGPVLPARLAAELGQRIGRNASTLAESAVIEPGAEPPVGYTRCEARLRANARATGGRCGDDGEPGACRACWGPLPVAYESH